MEKKEHFIAQLLIKEKEISEKILSFAKNPEICHILQLGGCTKESCSAPWDTNLVSLSLRGMINYLATIGKNAKEGLIIESLTEKTQEELSYFLGLYLEKDEIEKNIELDSFLEEKYFMPSPFGDYHEVTKEEYEARKQKNEADIDERKREREKHEKFSQDLRNLGYVYMNEDYSEFVDKYKKRFQLVMGQKNISHIQKVPEYVEHKNQSTDLQLFPSHQGGIIKSKVNDIYHSQLTEALDNFEKNLVSTYFNGRKMDDIMRIFVLGNITDPMLFYRFESLKTQNNKHYIQRMFLYGYRNAEDIEKNKDIQECLYLDSESLSYIGYFSNAAGCNMFDIGLDRFKLIEKIKNSYIFSLKNSIGLKNWETHFHSLFSSDEDLYSTLDEHEKLAIENEIKKNYYLCRNSRWEYMLNYEKNGIIEDMRLHKNLQGSNNREDEFFNYVYNFGFYPTFLQTQCGFSKEELNSFRREAREQFINEIPSTIESLSFVDFPYFEDLSYGKMGKQDFSIYYSGTRFLIQKISYALRQLQEIGSVYYSSIDIEKLNQKFVQKLLQLIKDGIQKIENKEKVTGNVPWENKKLLSYKNRISDAALCIDEMCNILQSIDPSALVSLDWENNKQLYVAEYKEFHKNRFIEKRVFEVLVLEQLDINDYEEIKKTIIKNGEQELLSACYKKIKLGDRQYSSYDSITTFQVFSFIKNNALFNKGYSSLLKYIYPDNKERSLVRSDIIRSIIKNSLLTIQKNLLSKGGFNNSYCLIEPLLYRYKKYNGNIHDIGLDTKTIEKEYLLFIDIELQENYKQAIITVNSGLQKKGLTKEKLYLLYNDFVFHSSCTNKYLGKLINKVSASNKIKNYGGEFNFIHDKNQKWSDVCSKDCIFLLSLWGFCIDDIHPLISPTMRNHICTFFNDFTKIKEIIWKQILSDWFSENTIPGGKINRMVDEQLFITFGPISKVTNEHVSFVVQYILDNVLNIFLDDISHGALGGNAFIFQIKDVVEKVIKEFVDKWKSSLDSSILLGTFSKQQLE